MTAKITNMSYVWLMKAADAESFILSSLREQYGQDEAGAIASVIAEEITGMSRAERLIHNAEIPGEKEKYLHHCIRQLMDSHPLQYVVHKAWFAGMELFVDESVLIPRPETEELVEWVASDVRKSFPEVFDTGPNTADKTSRLKILDVGTGSGCIALALKKAMPLAEVWGCDNSDEALNIARRNGAALNIRVDFQNADFLDPAQHRGLPSVDIVVSNPPYIPHSESKFMPANVVRFEPHNALFVPDDDPLVFYRALLEFSAKRLHAGGSIYMEIHESLAKEAAGLFSDAGFTAELRNDMQGKARMLRCRKTAGE